MRRQRLAVRLIDVLSRDSASRVAIHEGRIALTSPRPAALRALRQRRLEGASQERLMECFAVGKANRPLNLDLVYPSMGQYRIANLLSETLVSWRLLAGGLSPWLSHRSYSTTSEEPPLSNFNSYRDIPACFHLDQ